MQAAIHIKVEAAQSLISPRLIFMRLVAAFADFRWRYVASRSADFNGRDAP